MHKERYQFIGMMIFLMELIIVSVNFFAVYFLIQHFHSFYTFDLFPDMKIMSSPREMDLYLRVFWFVLVIWSVVLRARGEYHHLPSQTFPRILTHHLINGCIFFAFFATGAFLFKFGYVSRLFMILYTASTVFWLLLSRLFIVLMAYYIRRRGYISKNILLAGTGRRAQDFMSLAARHKEWGYHIIGLVDLDPTMVGKKVAGYKVLGRLEDVPKILEKRVVDEVIFIVPRNWLKELEDCILYCEAVGVPATLSTDFYDLEIASGVPREMDGFTYVTFETSRIKEPELWLKRLFDIGLSSAFLAVMSPVFLTVALLVKLTSKGPVLFKQVRSGLNGRKFMLYKFRSMVVGAESQLEKLKGQNEMTGPVFKITKDPRVTPLGRFIRKTSLDEFPQFWNVLKGDMSIVGPRPAIPSEVSQYEPWQRRRLSMKPGITCIWQVTGRNKIGFEDWMKLDLQYIDKWSLWLDIKILFMTARAVFLGSGK